MANLNNFSNAKVAICLSGQPRMAKQTFNLILNNIIKPNNADVFIHLNYDENSRYIDKSHADNGDCILDESIDKWIIENYKPIRYLIESPKQYRNKKIGLSPSRLNNHKRMNNHKSWNDNQHQEYIINNMYNMYYSIYKCNELKELYAQIDN